MLLILMTGMVFACLLVTIGASINYAPLIDWFRLQIHQRLEVEQAKAVLFLPYVTWSDTVTHTHTYKALKD